MSTSITIEVSAVSYLAYMYIGFNMRQHIWGNGLVTGEIHLMGFFYIQVSLTIVETLRFDCKVYIYILERHPRELWVNKLHRFTTHPS